MVEDDAGRHDSGRAAALVGGCCVGGRARPQRPARGGERHGAGTGGTGTDSKQSEGSTATMWGLRQTRAGGSASYGAGPLGARRVGTQHVAAAGAASRSIRRKAQRGAACSGGNSTSQAQPAPGTQPRPLPAAEAASLAKCRCGGRSGSSLRPWLLRHRQTGRRGRGGHLRRRRERGGRGPCVWRGRAPPAVACGRGGGAWRSGGVGGTTPAAALSGPPEEAPSAGAASQSTGAAVDGCATASLGENTPLLRRSSLPAASTPRGTRHRCMSRHAGAQPQPHAACAGATDGPRGPVPRARAWRWHVASRVVLARQASQHAGHPAPRWSSYLLVLCAAR
jgi:hypothetical protein